MTEKILYWTTVVMACLAVILFVADASMINSNQTMQTELTQRQNVVAMSARITPLAQQLASALAEAAVKDNDQRLRDLLSSQGIMITNASASPAPAAAAAPPAPAPAPKALPQPAKPAAPKAEE